MLTATVWAQLELVMLLEGTLTASTKGVLCGTVDSRADPPWEKVSIFQGSYCFSWYLL